MLRYKNLKKKIEPILKKKLVKFVKFWKIIRKHLEKTRKIMNFEEVPKNLQSNNFEISGRIAGKF